jgi:hypothetical protein
MGTNFYIRGGRHSEDPDLHLGKRSAAGLYCWDCNRTLCKGGEPQIHHESAFFDSCPSCGKKPEPAHLESSAVGRELGFNKSTPKRKTGVDGCASFSWCVPPGILEQLIQEHEACPTCDRPWHTPEVIENEYGDLYTLDEFKGVLEECPVQFTHSVGQSFS